MRTVKLMGMILLIMKVHVNGSQSVFSLTCIYKYIYICIYNNTTKSDHTQPNVSLTLTEFIHSISQKYAKSEASQED